MLEFPIGGLPTLGGTILSVTALCSKSIAASKRLAGEQFVQWVGSARLCIDLATALDECCGSAFDGTIARARTLPANLFSAMLARRSFHRKSVTPVMRYASLLMISDTPNHGARRVKQDFRIRGVALIVRRIGEARQSLVQWHPRAETRSTHSPVQCGYGAFSQATLDATRNAHDALRAVADMA